jgi:hypothetical protein
MIEIRHKHRFPCSLGLLVQCWWYFSVLTKNETCQQHLVIIRHMKFNRTPLKNYRSKICAPTQCMVTVSYRVLGTNYRPHLQGSRRHCILTTFVGSDWTSIIHSNIIKQVVFVMEAGSVFFKVVNEFVFTVQMNLTLYIFSL